MIIGICSPSGGGKTTLIKKLSEALENSSVIHFDDYGDPFWAIDDFDGWIAGGADMNEVKTAELTADLKRLKSEKTGKIILFDTLVGRSQEETGDLIDYLIYLDVPLELALSRRVLRMISECGTDLREKLKDFLEAYSGRTGPRQIYGAIRKQTRDRADLIIGGEGSAEEMSEEILSKLRALKYI